MRDEQTLDPQNWDETRRVFHDAVDSCLDWMRDVRSRPVWQPTPESVKVDLHAPLPVEGASPAELLAWFESSLLPYATGNTHPRFWGWVHGSGTAPGVLGEMLAAFMNCNVGGRDHVAVYVERQVLDWCRDIFGFPSTSGGLLTGGTSISTVVALASALTQKFGVDLQTEGLASLPKRPVGYASQQAHGCVTKAFRLLGLGSSALRIVPVGMDYRMEVTVLREMVHADRAAGLAPFVVIGSAGTVNTGAVDLLDALADLCAEEQLWLHVDGAFGALAILAPEYRQALAAISRCDSLAFDFHKWLHVPYDAGCVLIKDEAAQRAAFSGRREYLAGLEAGLAGGDPWFCDYGPDLSRGFRALKVWFTLRAFGTQKLGELIAQNCRQAAYLGELVERARELELSAAVSLNIVCFRYVAEELSEEESDALNTGIVTDLQTAGIAAPSTTRIHGRVAIRVAITNHRTRCEDLELLVAEVRRLGKARVSPCI